MATETVRVLRGVVIDGKTAKPGEYYDVSPGTANVLCGARAGVAAGASPAAVREARPASALTADEAPAPSRRARMATRQ